MQLGNFSNKRQTRGGGGVARGVAGGGAALDCGVRVSGEYDAVMRRMTPIDPTTARETKGFM